MTSHPVCSFFAMVPSPLSEQAPRRRDARPEAPGFGASESPLALVVVTRNRSALFERYAVESLREASAEGAEVVVIDQSDERTTATLASQVGGIGYVRCAPGLSRGRNLAVRRTQAPVVAFIDDDVRIGPGWVTTMSELFAGHPEIGAVCGRGLDGRGRELPGGAAGLYGWPASPFGLGSGFNLAFRREALSSAGDFDEDLGAGARFRSAEDTDMLYRVLRERWGVLCSDRVTVTHYDWRSFREEILIHRDYGLGAGAFTRKHSRAGDRTAWAFARREGDGHLRTLGRAVVTLRPRLALLQVIWLAGFRRGHRPRPDRRPLAAPAGPGAGRTGPPHEG